MGAEGRVDDPPMEGDEMSQVLDHEFQSLVSEAICHEARMAGALAQQAVCEYQRPSALFRPRLSVDGDQWCVLYGENLQEGCAGFGSSPDAAMRDFDLNWSLKLTPRETK
jgi:hypothetical protein